MIDSEIVWKNVTTTGGQAWYRSAKKPAFTVTLGVGSSTEHTTPRLSVYAHKYTSTSGAFTTSRIGTADSMAAAQEFCAAYLRSNPHIGAAIMRRIR